MIEKLKHKFDIIRKIGEGGMANIFLATYKNTDQKVAIKILSPENAKSAIQKRRFKEEIKLSQNIDSPYVIKIYDSYWGDDIQYIVMEYIPGHIFKNYIQRRTRLTPEETIDFAKQLALGFEAIHNQGIIHRDIKSSNVMVGNHGELKIIDFGIAITKESDRLTKVDNVIGSVHYMAPEILDKQQLTNQSDIYALGILMFEMLTGDLPFREESAVKTALKHKESEVPMVNKFFDSIPQSLTNIIAKATAKDLSKRYKSMLELYKDLDTCLNPDRINEPLLIFNEKNKKTFKEIINSKWMLIGIISSTILLLLTIIITLLVVK